MFGQSLLKLLDHHLRTLYTCTTVFTSYIGNRLYFGWSLGLPRTTSTTNLYTLSLLTCDHAAGPVLYSIHVLMTMCHFFFSCCCSWILFLLWWSVLSPVICHPSSVHLQFLWHLVSFPFVITDRCNTASFVIAHACVHAWNRWFDWRIDLFINWLKIVGSLLLIVGFAENPLKSQMKKYRTIRLKAKCSITAERQLVFLIYYLYKTIHMDALILTVLACPLVTVNDFHHFLWRWRRWCPTVRSMKSDASEMV